MLGPALALAAAMTFALNNATLRRGVLSGTPLQAIAITVPLGALLTLVAMSVAGLLPVLGGFSLESLAWLALAGIIHFNVGRYCNYRAIKAMGANLVGPVQEAGLLWTVLLALVLLGESITIQQGFGMALVVLAPMLALKRRKTPSAELAASPAEVPRRTVPVFEPRYLEGYVFAGLSAIAFGTSPILIAAGIPSGLGVAGGLAGTLVSYVAATIFIGFTLFIPGRLAHSLVTSPTAVRWFTVSGVLVCLSQMTRYMALAVAPVTIVTPIQRTAIVFRLIFSRIINPGHEVFDRSIFVAAGFSLLGVLLLSMETRVIAQVIPLSDRLVSQLSLVLF